MLSLKNKIEPIVNGLLAETKYEALELTVAKSQHGIDLFLMVDYKNREDKVSIDDCVSITKSIQSTLLQHENFKDTVFFINVESPGIDRPLFNIKDYENSIGFDIKLKLLKPLSDNTLSLKAELVSVEDGKITINYNNSKHVLHFSDIASAKVVFNDKLIKKLNLFKKK